LQAAQGQEAEQLLALDEARLEKVCARTKIKKELLDRAVQRSYQRCSGPTTRNFRLR